MTARKRASRRRTSRRHADSGPSDPRLPGSPVYARRDVHRLENDVIRLNDELRQQRDPRRAISRRLMGPDVTRDDVGTFVANLRALADSAAHVADVLARDYGLRG
jgi:hypothetical protein